MLQHRELTCGSGICHATAGRIARLRKRVSCPYVQELPCYNRDNFHAKENNCHAIVEKIAMHFKNLAMLA